MATRIRLKRGGRKGKPYYRIVVQDARVRNRGPELDIIGYHHPAARPEPVSEVNVHKALQWLRNGAQMSDTTHSVMSKLGVLKHYHDGTTPEEPTAALTGSVIENKGYNPPPPSEPEAEPAPAEAEAPTEPEAAVETAEATEETNEAQPVEAETGDAPDTPSEES